MKFTGIAAFFAAMTAVTAAPLGVAADVGQVGNEVKQEAGSLLGGVKRGDLGQEIGQLVPVKRDADLTNVASNLTPELKKLNILPGNIGVEQVTQTLNVLNVQGLLGNVTPLLNNLVGGLLGDVLGGVLGGGQSSQITQVAGSLLPKVTNILPGVGQEQLGSLLSLLQQNNALKELPLVGDVL